MRNILAISALAAASQLWHVVRTSQVLRRAVAHVQRGTWKCDEVLTVNRINGQTGSTGDIGRREPPEAWVIPARLE